MEAGIAAALMKHSCPDGTHSFRCIPPHYAPKHIGAFLEPSSLLDNHYIIAEHFGNLVVSDVRRQPQRLCGDGNPAATSLW